SCIRKSSHVHGSRAYRRSAWARPNCRPAWYRPYSSSYHFCFRPGGPIADWSAAQRRLCGESDAVVGDRHWGTMVVGRERARWRTARGRLRVYGAGKGPPCEWPACVTRVDPASSRSACPRRGAVRGPAWSRAAAALGSSDDWPPRDAWKRSGVNIAADERRIATGNDAGTAACHAGSLPVTAVQAQCTAAARLCAIASFPCGFRVADWLDRDVSAGAARTEARARQAWRDAPGCRCFVVDDG